MAFDFPASPVEDQQFTPPGGPTYVYKSGRWVSLNFTQGTIPEAPNDGLAYVRQSLGWVVGYTKAVVDTLLGGKVAKSGDTMTGDLVIAKAAPGITLDRSAPAQNAGIYIRTATVGRWYFGANNTAEGGANSGGDWSVIRYSDAGAFLDYAIQIDRATGNVNMAGGATVPTPPLGDNDTSVATTAFVKTLLATADRYNMIVNPSMMVSQENGSTAGTVNNYYQADQWQTQWAGVAVVGSWQTYISSAQTQEPSSGNRWHARLYVSTADVSIAAGDYVTLQQSIEGTSIAPLKWGLSDARPAVLRFSALVGIAGTFSVTIRDYGGTVSCVIPFTVGAGEANTWKDYVFAIPPCTIGTWPDGTAAAMRLGFSLSVGSTFVAPSNNTWVAGNFLGVSGNTNWLATVNNNFYVTDVGLYLDINGTGRAPQYEIPDFATELSRCQRYWQEHYNMASTHGCVSANLLTGCITLPVTSRTLGAILSGVNSSASNFPATVGTLSLFGSSTIRETRNASATASSGSFATSYTVNARM